jgi:ubiquinone/menaquinone biosynthesis C-methylase UbiE
MQRILEPEVMDSWQEALDYDAMDFVEVNTAFANLACDLGPNTGRLLDAGTGTARIPILLAQRCPEYQIIAIDLAENMLKLGQTHVDAAGLSAQIELALVDAKNLPYPAASFDMVISNSIVHHLPDPLPFLSEVQRVLKPGGVLLLRDLLRPATPKQVDALVDQIGPEYNDHQRQLFADSLRAAFTLAEIKALLDQAGFTDIHTYQSSDRHWTAQRPWKKIKPKN